VLYVADVDSFLPPERSFALEGERATITQSESGHCLVAV